MAYFISSLASGAGKADWRRGGGGGGGGWLQEDGWCRRVSRRHVGVREAWIIRCVWGVEVVDAEECCSVCEVKFA